MTEARKAIRRAVQSALGGELTQGEALREIYSIANDDGWWDEEENPKQLAGESEGGAEEEEEEGPGFLETFFDIISGD